MALSISTEILTDILGLPKETKTSTIIATIQELVQFKNSHNICKDSLREVSSEITDLRTEV